ncbi:hypothetical protein [Tsukamurella hominis]|uniref:hypothetical protein n=1 Tax=Tsukamurella hominis TaxID=1970232 RepID=UPI0039ED399C
MSDRKTAHLAEVVPRGRDGFPLAPGAVCYLLDPPHADAKVVTIGRIDPVGTRGKSIPTQMLTANWPSAGEPQQGGETP